MLADLVLFSYSAPDLMMAIAAVFATLCGLVLMGGRSAIGLLLKLLASLRRRRVLRQREEPIVIPFAPCRSDQAMYEKNVRGADLKSGACISIFARRHA